MSITTNNILSLSKSSNSEINKNQNLKEEEINTIISLFLFRRIFISFKRKTTNL